MMNPHTKLLPICFAFRLAKKETSILQDVDHIENYAFLMIRTAFDFDMNRIGPEDRLLCFEITG
jgi:hypothetical protein